MWSAYLTYLTMFLNIKNFKERANIVLNEDVHQGILYVIEDNEIKIKVDNYIDHYTFLVGFRTNSGTRRHRDDFKRS